MSKIAVEAKQTQPPVARRLAAGQGWAASEVVCTAGPSDRPFEEKHCQTSIAVVLGGTFQYRTTTGKQLMTPGSVLLGNPGDSFCCGHEHGVGDRCFAVSYAPEFFESFAGDTYRSGGCGPTGRFALPRIPPLRDLAGLAANAERLLTQDEGPTAYEEIAIQLAASAIQLEQGLALPNNIPPPSALARVTRVVRFIEHEPHAPHNIEALARLGGLSPYHFLRSFQEVTGVTPHQYMLRLRLRRAAIRLKAECTELLTIALDCGFADASHFSRAFRTEFGVTPSAYRGSRRKLCIISRQQ